ncbi:succinate-semialdehyde dehydrogenase [Fusarium acutatum]|uniref:Succinate-semialdehyde dehydrogenase n=1 Tax=Fusarium acutatum TaxID=78861 RepID=A0A8H4NVE1_9HYPO|nr:succinate-semialdehyde dehydrogenase [Fusarium acutatum]
MMATVSSRTVKSLLRDPSLFREQAYINGQWTEGGATSRFLVFNPYSQENLGSCPDLDTSGTEDAINVAQKAFKDFQHSSARERKRILKDWFELMQEHEKDLATILSLENGRPIEAAHAEIKYAASFLEWFEGESVRSYGDSVQASARGTQVITIKQPIGVVGIITPWNFPSAMITRKAGAALAAGCSMVIKPAAETPYSALALAELGHRAGVPAGVINVLTTQSNTIDVGKLICEHPSVKKLSFTGSTGVGKTLMQQSSQSLKKLSMELGGNAPFVGKLMDTINEQLVKGDPLSSGTTIGPLINAKATKKVERLVEDAVQHGANLVLGGTRSADDPENYCPPTILTGMTHSMQASKEELFGPVVAIYSFEDEKHLIAMANDSDVGLGAYVYTDALSQAWRTAEMLQTGMVGVNTGVISDPVAPFGGVKHSGFGREGGRTGIEEFQALKTVSIGGLDGR